MEFIHTMSLLFTIQSNTFCGFNDDVWWTAFIDISKGRVLNNTSHPTTISIQPFFCKSCQMIPMVNGIGNAWIVCYSVWIWRMLIQQSIVHVAKARRAQMRNWPEGFLIRAAQAFLNDLSFSSGRYYISSPLLFPAVATLVIQQLWFLF